MKHSKITLALLFSFMLVIGGIASTATAAVPRIRSEQDVRHVGL